MRDPVVMTLSGLTVDRETADDLLDQYPESRVVGGNDYMPNVYLRRLIFFFYGDDHPFAPQPPETEAQLVGRMMECLLRMNEPGTQTPELEIGELNQPL